MNFVRAITTPIAINGTIGGGEKSLDNSARANTNILVFNFD